MARLCSLASGPSKNWERRKHQGLSYKLAVINDNALLFKAQNLRPHFSFLAVLYPDLVLVLAIQASEANHYLIQSSPSALRLRFKPTSAALPGLT